MQIGVLDIQGSVEEHLAMLGKIGASAVAVKTKKDLDEVDGLIIPGGESTTIGKLMKKYRLDEEIKKRGDTLTIWGSCAGAILLAKKIRNRKPDALGLMDIEIARNAYGRQIDSFETKLSVPSLRKQKIPAIFIRAPRVKKASPKVKVLAEYRGEPVMLQQENLLATMFHPELTNDPTIHRYFLELVATYAKSKNGY
ncbi:pyridoxal 5'-phosphate synthase glutaminase subunit PdxT [Candidatus Peregrinibacteria bacterium]|nr:pyridoxal 5'-phosphate synthase glutaminase subunit PdxT [Candidatus Peregrinibacteria bacterium]